MKIELLVGFCVGPNGGGHSFDCGIAIVTKPTDLTSARRKEEKKVEDFYRENNIKCRNKTHLSLHHHYWIFC
jgi:hypothetical protein